MVSYDASAETDDVEKPLISIPCMRSLVKMAGVVFSGKKNMRKRQNKVIFVSNNFFFSLMIFYYSFNNEI